MAGRASPSDGTFVLTGVRYRFECFVFVDHVGAHFLAHLVEFEAAEWSAQLAMG